MEDLHVKKEAIVCGLDDLTACYDACLGVLRGENQRLRGELGSIRPANFSGDLRGDSQKLHGERGSIRLASFSGSRMVNPLREALRLPGDSDCRNDLKLLAQLPPVPTMPVPTYPCTARSVAEDYLKLSARYSVSSVSNGVHTGTLDEPNLKMSESIPLTLQSPPLSHRGATSPFKSSTFGEVPIPRQDVQVEPRGLGNSIVERWERLVDLKREQCRQEDMNVKLELRSTWLLAPNEEEAKEKLKGIHTLLSTTKTVRKTHSNCAAMQMSVSDGSAAISRTMHAGEQLRVQSRMQALVQHPDKKLSLLRSLIGTALIMYDVALFPMFAFEFGESTGLVVMTWVTACYWAVDIPMSFFQGFHTRGVVEMRPRKTAMSYMKSWFCLDLMLVIVDWFFLIADIFVKEELKGDQAGGLRILRTFRSTRLLRALRSVRFIRLFGVVNKVFDNVLSESLLIFSRLAILVLIMLMICHYVACGWYVMAVYYKDADATWVSAYHLQHESGFAKYICALHWSLTQFTPATNNLAPVNPAERLFAVVIVLFALVMFSNFVSTLTNATMQLRKINYDYYKEEQHIRQFLHSKEVPLDISNRIWHFYRQHYRVRKKELFEGDIPLFGSLPTSLLTALHQHIYLPILKKHAVFLRCSTMDNDCMLVLCNEAICERCILQGGEVFNFGDEGQYMYFVKNGALLYDCGLYPEINFLGQDSFISEATLWSKWVHCGHLSVSKFCEMLQVDAFRFELLMHQRARESGALRCLRTYAVLFAQMVSDYADAGQPITDILGDSEPKKLERIISMTARAFTADQEEQKAMVKINTRKKLATLKMADFGVFMGRLGKAGSNTSLPSSRNSARISNPRSSRTKTSDDTTSDGTPKHSFGTSSAILMFVRGGSRLSS